MKIFKRILLALVTLAVVLVAVAYALPSRYTVARSIDIDAPSSTRVTWTNEGELGNNPMMRWMGLAMDRMVGNDFAAGLVNLKALATK